MVKSVPEGFRYADAVPGRQRLREGYGPDKKSITHADLQIGDSILMLNDEFPGRAAAPVVRFTFTSRMWMRSGKGRSRPAPR